MAIILGVLFIALGSILVFLNISYSPVKSEFARDMNHLMQTNFIHTNENFSYEDFAHMPVPIQRYINYAGYIGTPKATSMEMKYHNVNFTQSRGQPALKINYIQYNFVKYPDRIAYIDSKLFGIPFEGYDYFSNGIGGMKGIIGKAITIFHQTGNEMDKACLVTFLAESIFLPNALLQNYINFEEIDSNTVKATITYQGIIASGIFEFNDLGEMVLFTSNDRSIANPDGTMNYVKWSAKCGDYQKTSDGIIQPTTFQATWNYEDGDFVYFNGNITSITYNYDL